VPGPSSSTISKSRKEGATAKAVEAAGAEAKLVQGDVSEDADCRKIAATAAVYGKLDALVNNAGTTKHVPKHADLDGLSKEDFLRIFATNTVAPFRWFGPAAVCSRRPAWAAC